MLRRNWFPILALIGIGLAAYGAPQLIRNYAGSQYSAAQAQEKPKADAPPAASVAVQNGVQGAASAAKATNQNQAATKADQRADRDLKAQEIMALSARLMLFVAVAEILITAAGVFLIYRTLEATWAAKNEAKRAADAAEKTVTQAESHGRRVIRAYISTYKTTVKLTGVTVEGKVRFKNYGNTPTYKSAWDAAFWLDTNPPKKIPEIDLSTAVNINVPPGGRVNQVHQVELTAKQLQEIREGKKFIWCTGLFEYLDTFNQRRFVSFRYLAGDAELVEGKAISMFFAEAGNEFN